MAGETKQLFGTAQTGIVSIAANIAANYVAGNNAVYDNTVSYAPYGVVEVSIGGGFASAPTANTYLTLWGVPLLNDGSTYATQGGSVTSTPAAESGFVSSAGAIPLGRIYLANSASASKQQGVISTLGIKKMKVFVKNESGQTLNAGAGTELTVSITPLTLAPA